MSRHLLDETAEFRMPGRGRHTSPETGELEVTQRMEPLDQSRPARRPRPDDDAQER